MTTAQTGSKGPQNGDEDPGHEVHVRPRTWREVTNMHTVDPRHVGVLDVNELRAVQQRWLVWLAARRWPGRSAQRDLVLLEGLVEMSDAHGAVSASNRDLSGLLHMRPQTVMEVAKRLEVYGVTRTIQHDAEDGFNLPTDWRLPETPPWDLCPCDKNAPTLGCACRSSSSLLDLDESDDASTPSLVGAVASHLRVQVLDDFEGMFSEPGLGPHARTVVNAAINGHLPSHPLDAPARPRLTAGDLARLTGVNPRTAQRLLRRWTRSGFVERVGRDAHPTYRLPPWTHPDLVGNSENPYDRAERVRYLWFQPNDYLTPAAREKVRAARERADAEASEFTNKRKTLRATWPEELNIRAVSRWASAADLSDDIADALAPTFEEFCQWMIYEVEEGALREHLLTPDDEPLADFDDEMSVTMLPPRGLIRATPGEAHFA